MDAPNTQPDTPIIKSKTFWLNCLLVPFLIGGIYLFFFCAKTKAIKDSERYMLPLCEVEQALIEGVSNANLEDIVLKRNLIDRMLLIKDKKVHHEMIFKDLFAYYYATIITLHLASVLAGIFAFLIINTGWKNAHSSIRLAFVLLAGAAAYYGLFPSIFEQKATIKDNLTCYMNYSLIELDIYNYSTTKQMAKSDSISAKFLNEVNTGISQAMGIYFGMDDIPIVRENFLKKMTTGK